MGIPEGLIFIDAGTSGAKHHMKRPQFRQMNALVEGGDVGTLWVSELTRLGRDTLGTIECLISLWNRGVTVHALNEYDEKVLSADPIYRPILISALSLSGDLERRHNMERTRIALETARLRGVKVGRPKINVPRKKLEADMQKYGVSMNVAAKINGIKPSTLSRARKEWKEEDSARSAGTSQPSA
jgi:DNA invertase Pin-like site-specific DNA recombinase